MSNASLVVLLLGVITCCLGVMAVAILSTARAFRRTMDRVNAMLPAVERTVQATHDSMQRLQELLGRTNHATRHMEGVVHRVCVAAAETLDQWSGLKSRTRNMLMGWFGNGARAEPRRSDRRHR